MRVFGRGRRDRELTEEIDTHLALAEDEYRRAGMSNDEARDAARRAFGGVLRTRQMYRERYRFFRSGIYVRKLRSSDSSIVSAA